jgi:DNA-binding PadR family transcriptional regulator
MQLIAYESSIFKKLHKSRRIPMALAHAILASLVERPCSGYDLAKQFDGSVGFFWSASHQQIYRELSKLETQGWIASETIPQEGRPDKKVYQVTEAGKQQLLDWIAQPCEPTPIKDDLLVKIFSGYVAQKQTILEELERHRQAHLEKLSTYKVLEQRYFRNPQPMPEQAKFQYLTLLNGMSYETHWLAWCEQAIHLLSS